MEADGTTVSTTKMPNIAMCNHSSKNGGLAVDVSNEIDGADVDKTKIKFIYHKAGFTCLEAPIPPEPPAPLPTTGKFSACGEDTDCGDTTLCCGV